MRRRRRGSFSHMCIETWLYICRNGGRLGVWIFDQAGSISRRLDARKTPLCFSFIQRMTTLLKLLGNTKESCLDVVGFLIQEH
jgi:hypothetical protein